MVAFNDTFAKLRAVHLLSLEVNKVKCISLFSLLQVHLHMQTINLLLSVLLILLLLLDGGDPLGRRWRVGAARRRSSGGRARIRAYQPLSQGLGLWRGGVACVSFLHVQTDRQTCQKRPSLGIL